VESRPHHTGRTREIFGRLGTAAQKVFQETPQSLPPLSDFPGYGGKDTKKRFMVVVTHRVTPDERYKTLIPKERERVEELKQSGVILSTYFPPPTARPWQGFMVLREDSARQVLELLQTLPLAHYLNFNLVELAQS
jgi:muconolactone delta-isomerase